MRRLATGLGVVLVVVLALLAVVDRVAVHVVDSALARQVEGQVGGDPSVRVRGIPFLTQVVRGRYGDVDVTAPSVVRDGLRLEQVHGQLQGVHLPLRTALGGHVTTVPVNEVGFTAVVPWSQLERLAAQKAGAGSLALRDVRLSSTGAPDEVRVSATVTVLGQSLTATAVSGVRLVQGSVALSARQLQIGGVQAPAAFTRALGDRLDLTLPLPTLPYGLQLGSLVAQSDGVLVRGSGRDVVLHR